MAGKSITARIALEGADEIKKQIDGVTDSFKQLQEKTSAAAGDIKTDGIDKLGEVAQQSGEKVAQAFTDAGQKATEALSKIGEGLGLDKIGDDAEKSAERVLKPYDEAAANVKKSLEDIGDGNPLKKIGPQAEKSADDVKDAFKTVAKDTGSVFDQLAEGAKKALDLSADGKGLKDKLSGPIKDAADSALKEIERISDGFKKLAQGGDLTGAGEKVKTFGAQAQAAMKAFNDALQKTKGLDPEVGFSLQKVSDALFQLRTTATQSGGIFSGMEQGAAGAAQTFGGLAQTSGGLAGSLLRIGGLVGGVVGALELIGRAIDGIKGRFADLGRDSAAGINEIAKAARSVGTSTADFQSFSRAMKTFGVDVADTQKALTRLQDELNKPIQPRSIIDKSTGKEVTDLEAGVTRVGTKLESVNGTLRMIQNGVGVLRTGFDLAPEKLDEFNKTLRGIHVNLDDIKTKGGSAKDALVEILRAVSQAPPNAQGGLLRALGLEAFEGAVHRGMDAVIAEVNKLDGTFGTIGQKAETAADRNERAANRAKVAWEQVALLKGQPFIDLDTARLEASARSAETFGRALKAIVDGRYGDAIVQSMRSLLEFVLPQSWVEGIASAFRTLSATIRAIWEEDVKRAQQAAQAIRDAFAKAKGDNNAPGGSTLGREAGNEIAESMRKAQEETDKTKQKVDEAARSQLELTDKVKETGAAFDAMGNATIPAAAGGGREALGALGGALDDVRQRMRGLSEQQGGPPPAVTDTGAAVEAVGAQIVKTDETLKNLGANAATPPVLENTNRALEQVDRKAQTTGQTLERIGAGANVNTLADGVEKLSSDLQTTSGNAADAKGALSGVGQTLRDALGGAADAVSSGLKALWREFGVGSAAAAEDVRGGLAKAADGDPLKPLEASAQTAFQGVIRDAQAAGQEVPKALGTDADPFKALSDRAKAAFDAVLGQIRDVASALAGLANADNGADPFKALSDRAAAAFKSIVDGAKSVADAIAGVSAGDNDPFAKLAERAKAAFNDVKTAAGEVGDALKGALSAQSAGAADPMKPLTDGVIAAKTAFDDLPTAAQGAFDGVLRAADASFSALEQRLQTLSQAIESALSGGSGAGAAPAQAGATPAAGGTGPFAPLSAGIDEVIQKLADMRASVAQALASIPLDAQTGFNGLTQAADAAIAQVEQRLQSLQEAVQAALSGSSGAAAPGAAPAAPEGGAAAPAAPAAPQAAAGGVFAPFMQEVDAAIQKIAAFQQALGSLDFSAITSAVQNMAQAIANALNSFSGDNAAAAFDNLSQRGAQAFQSLQQAVDSAMQGIQQSVQSMVDSVNQQLDALEQRIAQVAAAAASAGSGGGGGGGGGAGAFASGGHVRGPGSGTSDSIPAWLSNGEFVIRAAAVRKFGPSLFHALNGLQVPNLLKKLKLPNFGGLALPRLAAGGPVSFGKFNWPKFASGGLVGAAQAINNVMSVPALNMPAPVVNVGGGGALAPVNLTIGKETITGLLAPADVVGKLTSAASQSRMRSAGRKPSWVRS